MDILIKGMEMPKEGHYYLEVFCDGEIRRLDNISEGFRDTEAKAVALPSHGDLIDEDEFRLVIYREIRKHKKDEPITMILKGILWEMDNAPVIVEATE